MKTKVFPLSTIWMDTLLSLTKGLNTVSEELSKGAPVWHTDSQLTSCTGSQPAEGGAPVFPLAFTRLYTCAPARNALEGNVTLSIPKGLLVTHPQGHTNRTQTRSLDNAEFLMWNYTLPSQWAADIHKQSRATQLWCSSSQRHGSESSLTSLRV